MTDDNYDGVTHAGVAVVAADTGRVLLAQRSMDATDDADVQETFEFPGGGLDDGEEAWAGAMREFREETRLPWPEGEVTGGWRSDDGIYQGFVYTVETEFPVENWTPTDEVQTLTWFTREDVESHSNLRPEVESGTDWDMIFGGDPMSDEALTAATQVGQAEEYLRVGEDGRESRASAPFEDEEPGYEPGAYDLDMPIPVHGIIAPEGVLSGDGRGFGVGAMNRRPLRLPLRDTDTDTGSHGGAYAVGSVDRMMRSDGMVHWEGALMPERAESLATKMQFFGGRYGVSVDGDQGALDTEREDGMWFSQVRAAGLTAVDIPAFHEAYIAFGPHPGMPESMTASAYESGDLIGMSTFDRGPGWVTDPKATNRIHDYWTKKGQPGYAKVGWGTNGDFTRAKKLIGAKIAEHSPDKMRYLNQIIAQWHFDALGYWPGDLDKPGNKTTAEARAERKVSAATEDVDYSEVTRLITKNLDRDDIEVSDETESVWETVLVSSLRQVSGNRPRPPLDYFHQHPSMVEDPWAAESGAMTIDEPDEMGFQRTWGYAAERGVCHVGMDGRCVEPPMTGSDDYPEFHLGTTRVEGGKIHTGVLTYGVGHRDADTMLSESPEQAMFDNINNAWAAVRVGENERGIWFSGVVLPAVDPDHLVKIEASGQVSGEWLAGAMRACLTVNVPGFPNHQASATYDEYGNVMALAASAFGAPSSPCTPIAEGADDDPITEIALAVIERIEARAKMDALRRADAAQRFADLKSSWEN